MFLVITNTKEYIRKFIIMIEENISQEFKLTNVHETRN